MFFDCKEDQCEQIFNSKKALNEHERTHKVDRQFRCKICKQRFIQMSSLNKHQRVHDELKPYTCPEEGCGKMFTQISNLRRHKKVHSGEKPFKCDYCDKSFSAWSNLKQHYRTHTNKVARQVFSCIFPGCNKSYLYPISLKQHLSKHHSNEYQELITTKNIQQNGFAKRQKQGSRLSAKSCSGGSSSSIQTFNSKFKVNNSDSPKSNNNLESVSFQNKRLDVLSARSQGQKLQLSENKINNQISDSQSFTSELPAFCLFKKAVRHLKVKSKRSSSAVHRQGRLDNSRMQVTRNLMREDVNSSFYSDSVSISLSSSFRSSHSCSSGGSSSHHSPRRNILTSPKPQMSYPENKANRLPRMFNHEVTKKSQFYMGSRPLQDDDSDAESGSGSSPESGDKNMFKAQIPNKIQSGQFELKVNRPRPQASSIKNSRQHEGVMKALINGTSYDELKGLRASSDQPVIPVIDTPAPVQRNTNEYAIPNLKLLNSLLGSNKDSWKPVTSKQESLASYSNFQPDTEMKLPAIPNLLMNNFLQVREPWPLKPTIKSSAVNSAYLNYSIPASKFTAMQEFKKNVSSESISGQSDGEENEQQQIQAPKQRDQFPIIDTNLVKHFRNLSVEKEANDKQPPEVASGISKVTYSVHQFQR